MWGEKGVYVFPVTDVLLFSDSKMENCFLNTRDRQRKEEEVQQ
jgi:hypothetical protein